MKSHDTVFILGTFVILQEKQCFFFFSGLLVLTVSCNLSSFTKFVRLLCHIPFELLYMLYLKMPLLQDPEHLALA